MRGRSSYTRIWSDAFWMIDVSLESSVRSEMKENADVERARPQIADELHPISGAEFLGRLLFDDHTLVDDHIEPLPSHVPPLVSDINNYFATNDMTSITELHLER